MSDKLNLVVNGFGSINQASLEINKINVIGGVNSSGKSTVSKLLYCFLKASVLSDEKYIKQILINGINNHIDLSESSLSVDDDFSQIIECYYKYADDSEEDEEITDLLNQYSYNKNYFYSFNLSNLINIENVDHFEGFSKISNSNFYSLLGNEDVNAEFDQGGFVEKYDKNEYDANTDFYVIKTEGDEINIPDVYYIDTFSILDLLNIITTVNQRTLFSVGNIYTENHIWYLNKALSKDDFSKKDSDKKFMNIFNKIDNIIKGIMSPPTASSDYIFVDNSKRSFDEYYGHYIAPGCGTENTSSGIKQFGIVELLLLNGELKPNTVLIFDEPEVNLHPEWQFKFAEILVLLAKELDVTIFMNSHSPMFIEAIEVLTQYYDMDNKTNFYLTEMQENEKYDFKKIDYDNLFELYDNLAKPFDIIEVYRLKNEYKKGNY